MNNQLGKTLAEIFCDKYIIPLYQRNFAWRIEEVQQLLQDVYDAFKKNPKGNYYIGSLVVLKRHNGDYEVIDGQQRLTVISMIAILLGCKELARPVLSYDSRPEVQEFFETLCKKADEAMRLTHASLYYLKEAYTHILHSRVENWGHKNSESFLRVDGISNFFLNHVILVRNEIPDDTDVAAYFEIMNNRGEQLQKHELVKAGMLDRIKTQDGGAYDLGKQQQFASVWDACSQMGTPIQRLFSVEERKGYFGEQYDGFLFVENNTGESLQGKKRSYSISEILGDDISASDCEQCSDTGDETETDVYEYDSIIDFPNFLMHVLRLYLNKYGDIPNGGDEIPLNEKELLSVYDEYADKIDPMKFIRLLLFCRTVFDRFVVKSTNDTHDQDDGKKWMLIKPKKNATCWNFVASFDKRVVKAISMLQVTSRSKIYKNWLFETLSWLFHECYESGNLSSVSSARYLSFIHDYMLKYYDEQHFNIKRLCDGENPTPKNSYSMGTETPHFLLNFIDYLYWCKFIKEGQPKIRDFDFKYWNTVEHHLARNKVDDDCPYINNLGNLCLVSKSSNSRLSDRDVKEKVEVYGHGNLGPNRQIIYSITKESLWVWGEDQIRTHYNELVELLDKRVSLLKSVIEDVDYQIEQLGGFITQNFFDCTLPNGYELTVAEGEDAESQNEWWCGRYFHLSKSNGETIKCWVGWRYGGTDKVAYGRQIDFSAEPSFAIQVPVEGFGVPGDSWYKTIWVGKWWNKELSFDIHNRDSWVKTVEEFKAEVLRLCEVLL